MSRPSKYLSVSVSSGTDVVIRGNFFPLDLMLHCLSNSDFDFLDKCKEMVSPYLMYSREKDSIGFAVRGKLLCVTCLVVNTRIFFPVEVDTDLSKTLLALF